MYMHAQRHTDIRFDRQLNLIGIETIELRNPPFLKARAFISHQYQQELTHYCMHTCML